MTPDEDDGSDVDEAPIDTLESYFAARGWTHERLGDDEIVGTAPGSWGSYELRGVWRDDDRVLQFLAFPDIRVAEDKRQAIYETVGLINEGLWLGHFELWAASGIVTFRHAAIVEGDEAGVLTVDRAELLVEAALDELDRFYPVFQFVLWGGKSPKDAIAAAMIDTAGEA
ncbi:hypothetical protein GGR88_000273 [Sphingomonas jejuensis]|uniref:YbjN domain-containing protein n=1 Tax=Sphingomonas jejuensis TaxID=904715 RepID=A0ABX0XIX9_9SPHN|nr:YbjN domain-containing protein [Sphingomonas jejuensis]NJC32799.1 hypothetical protein [Sphingomonas jejuensis]